MSTLNLEISSILETNFIYSYFKIYFHSWKVLSPDNMSEIILFVWNFLLPVIENIRRNLLKSVLLDDDRLQCATRKMNDCEKESIIFMWFEIFKSTTISEILWSKIKEELNGKLYSKIDGLRIWNVLCTPSVDFTHLSLSVIVTICDAAFLRSNSSAKWKHKRLLKWNENEEHNLFFKKNKKKNNFDL